MKKYIPSAIEPKWQKKWEKDGLYKIDLSDPKDKYYCLVELPYSSGDLHIGHWFAFAVADVFARLKRMQGKRVFYPIGFDAFGLPAENAAINRNLHPREWTLSNIESMTKQFKLMGSTLDFEHAVVTCEPQYYKWNQWIFLKMLERNIAYKGKTLSNWCPLDQTVLADEQVVNGKCDRCGSDIELREVEQWFLKITDYADRLEWQDNSKIDWPKAVKEGQNNWIGKSEGMEIEFSIFPASPAGRNFQFSIKAYTVFPETIFGVTYMVLAPEHQLVSKITTSQYKKEVEEYIKKSQKKSQQERISIDKTKTGIFTGAYCINPVNNKKVPIWIADYVIATYGTGAVMGVPGSDHRDFEFAQKYNLEVNRVIGKSASDQGSILTEKDVLEVGVIVNSAQFNGLTTPTPARDKIKDWLEEKGWGKRKIQYHLHDWSISRQRYWGTPIPIINCPKCGAVPVPYKDLPVELPLKVDHKPQGKPPLATAEKWMRVSCPKCSGDALREPETMDGFVDNSWYFYRYLSPNIDSGPFDEGLAKKWMPMEIYFGGAEHTLGHTMYSRFFTKFFFDLGLIGFDEYAKKRFNHGVILGPDGSRMSKSRGNVVNPDEQVKEYGADAIRLYLCFIGPYDLVAPWNPGGIGGVYHFLQRVWGLQEKCQISNGSLSRIFEGKTKSQMSNDDLRMMHKTIKKVTGDIEAIKFNTAVAALMEWLNYLSKKQEVSKEEYKTLLLLLAPFAPHITEELWSAIGEKYSIHEQEWPKFEEKYLEEAEVAIAVQVNGKVRDTIMIQKDMLSNKEVIEKLAKSSEKIQKCLEGKTVKNVVYVKGKVINFVVG